MQPAGSGLSVSESQRIRVLMAVPKYPYPIVIPERQSHELSKALAKLGIHVQALSQRFDLGPGCKRTGRGYSGMPYLVKQDSHQVYQNAFELLWCCGENDVATKLFICTSSAGSVPMPVLVAKLLALVTVKLSTVGPLSLPGFKTCVWGALKLAIFRMTDVVIAMSTESLAELDDIDFPRNRVLMTPNGIRMRESELAVATSTRASTPCRVVFVGRLDPKKGIADLLNAQRKSLIPPVVLYSLSCGAILDRWRVINALCSQLGIAETVMLRGHVESVRDKLAEMDLFVLASSREGIPTRLLEAMAAGSVISTRVGGTPMQVGRKERPIWWSPGM
ncbi:MAG: glycosyltransferase family 4 protein [Gammaproteobacteria bacterium]